MKSKEKRDEEKTVNNGTGAAVLIQIKKAMIDADCSVPELAKAIGVAPSTLYTRFKNPRLFTLRELLLINKVLGMEGIVIE